MAAILLTLNSRVLDISLYDVLIDVYDISYMVNIVKLIRTCLLCSITSNIVLY